MDEYKQVAALLNNKIEFICEYLLNGMSEEELKEQWAELNEYRQKITTDPEYRQEQYMLHFALFNIGR